MIARPHDAPAARPPSAGSRALFRRCIALLFAVGAVGCSSSLFDECRSVPLGKCKKVDTCCDSTDCYFVVDDEKEFHCASGKQCAAAEAQVRAYCGASADPAP